MSAQLCFEFLKTLRRDVKRRKLRSDVRRLFDAESREFFRKHGRIVSMVPNTPTNRREI